MGTSKAYGGPASGLVPSFVDNPPPPTVPRPPVAPASAPSQPAQPGAPGTPVAPGAPGQQPAAPRPPDIGGAGTSFRGRAATSRGSPIPGAAVRWVGPWRAMYAAVRAVPGALAAGWGRPKWRPGDTRHRPRYPAVGARADATPAQPRQSGWTAGRGCFRGADGVHLSAGWRSRRRYRPPGHG